MLAIHSIIPATFGTDSPENSSMMYPAYRKRRLKGSPPFLPGVGSAWLFPVSYPPFHQNSGIWLVLNADLKLIHSETKHVVEEDEENYFQHRTPAISVHKGADEKDRVFSTPHSLLPLPLQYTIPSTYVSIIKHRFLFLSLFSPIFLFWIDLFTFYLFSDLLFCAKPFLVHLFIFRLVILFMS